MYLVQRNPELGSIPLIQTPPELTLSFISLVSISKESACILFGEATTSTKLIYHFFLLWGALQVLY